MHFVAIRCAKRRSLCVKAFGLAFSPPYSLFLRYSLLATPYSLAPPRMQQELPIPFHTQDGRVDQSECLAAEVADGGFYAMDG